MLRLCRSSPRVMRSGDEVRARAERLCSYQKRIAVQTKRACTLEKCLTNYQCVTSKDVKTYGP